jgi:hypothetical protein
MRNAECGLFNEVAPWFIKELWREKVKILVLHHNEG